MAGGRARIGGLRGAPQLNGAIVILQHFDEENQRWVASLSGRSEPLQIRPRFLEAWQDPDQWTIGKWSALFRSEQMSHKEEFQCSPDVSQLNDSSNEAAATCKAEKN